MDGTSLGQRVAVTLLPYLADLTRPVGGPTLPGRSTRGFARARQLWEELQPQVAARPEMAAAVEHVRVSPSAAARRLLAAELQTLFQDDPRLAERVRSRLEQVERGELLRNRLRDSWRLGVLGVSLVGAIVTGAAVEMAWLTGQDDSVPLALAVVALLGVVFSAVVVYRRFPRAVNWLLVLLVVPVMVFLIDPRDVEADAHAAKIFAIFVLTVLPGWLYMQFVATRGRTLWEGYVTNLFRLRVDDYRNLPEPPHGSVEHQLWTAAGGPHAGHAGVLYRRKFEAAYASTVTVGRWEDAAGSRARGEGFAPVWITTLLTAFGWVAVLAPTYAGAMVFGGGEVLLGDPPQPFRFPLWEALAFGFVGAYWFNLQSLARRFFQNDLRTNAYISAITRYVVVAVLVAAAFAIRDLLGAGGSTVPGWFNGVAFAIGVFPNLGLQLVMKAVTKVVGRFADLDNQFPLTHLDGLSMWYEARLVEEGVEDLENLATADIVDLLLATRVPVGRTVDWIDQAYLYLRVTGPEQRRRLRTLGIRTATDLQDVFAAGDGTFAAASWPSRAELVAGVLHPEGTADAVGAVDILLAALEREPNLRHVRAWREYGPSATQAPPGSLPPDAEGAVTRPSAVGVTTANHTPTSTVDLTGDLLTDRGKPG